MCVSVCVLVATNGHLRLNKLNLSLIFCVCFNAYIVTINNFIFHIYIIYIYLSAEPNMDLSKVERLQKEVYISNILFVVTSFSVAAIYMYHRSGNFRWDKFSSF